MVQQNHVSTVSRLVILFSVSGLSFFGLFGCENNGNKTYEPETSENIGDIEYKSTEPEPSVSENIETRDDIRVELNEKKEIVTEETNLADNPSVSSDDTSTVAVVLMGDAEKEDDAKEDSNYYSEEYKVEEVCLDEKMLYASYSKIHTGSALLYLNERSPKGETVICINAGHGTNGGTQVKTLCHPDGSPKVTGGSTAAGAVEAIAVSSGMQFPDGTPEKDVTLRQAIILKEILLDSGYSVLMIRETDDVQLDNVARTVIANQYADCHIALHWDSSENDKGAFYCSVPNVDSYRRMEPVASTWEKSHLLGDCVIEDLRSEGVKIYAGGSMAIDLTQTSYSSIASIDLELGDKGSDYSDDSLRKNALGILEGIDRYFGFSSDG